MRIRVGLVAVLVALMFGLGPAQADDDKPDAVEDKDHDGKPDALAEDKDADGDGIPDVAERAGDIDGDGIPDADEEFDADDPPTDPFDADGDGVVEPSEIEDRKEFQAEFSDVPDDVDDAALEGRDEDAELKPSMTVEKFRKLVAIAKKVVLGKMATKIALKSDQRMRSFSWMVFGFSLAGILLLGMPLVLGKKYPGKGALLFKYSALAAVTFFVTVNLFGGVLYGLRTAQGALSGYTNPSIAIASGTFDTLDKNAEFYIVTGKELFGPTLEQMNKHPEEQPAVLILENGLKVVQDARVFLSITRMLKKVDFVFGILPIVLMLVTLVLFVLAIRPTLTEIVKLPVRAAAGEAGVGGEVVKRSMQRVKGELFATIGTVAVLAVLTLVSAFVLGKIVGPALEALLFYFSNAVSYLQFVEGASSGLVFVTLFGVVLFLVLNLATLILSMSFFLGKSQKIFQQRFNEGTPIATHARFWKWGIPAVLLVQVFPLVFIFVAQAILMKVNHGILDGVTDAEAVSWKKLMLMGPVLIIAGFAVLFWAVRGVKAIKFLATYKVKLPRVIDRGARVLRQGDAGRAAARRGERCAEQRRGGSARGAARGRTRRGQPARAHGASAIATWIPPWHLRAPPRILLRRGAIDPPGRVARTASGPCFRLAYTEEHMRQLGIILVLVIAAACGGKDKATTGGGGDTMPKTDTASLYDRLGKKDAIVAVVDDFVANVAADTRINAFFKNADIPKLKASLVDQICEAAGGPCKYTGKDMKTAHTGMGIKDADFTALVEDLKKSLDKFKVGQKEQDDLLGALGGMKKDIVTP